VGATVNAILGAVRADGVTVLRGAAREPHIVDLCTYLSACGADITGGGTDTVTVRGVPCLTGAYHRLMPDMIEAGTFLTAVGAAGGEIALRGVRREHLAGLISPLLAMGMQICDEGDAIVASRMGLLAPFDLVAAPYPALPTDMHPQLVALATQAAGVSYMRDTVFPDRLLYVRELQRMGGDVHVCDGRVRVAPSRLRGGRVSAVDLRAGAALAVGALAARGRTVICDAAVLERGYERFAEKLGSLGASVSVD
jgi:UDP-N-acetylglucosamine 1-carboxyvinyltransferase